MVGVVGSNPIVPTINERLDSNNLNFVGPIGT